MRSGLSGSGTSGMGPGGCGPAGSGSGGGNLGSRVEDMILSLDSRRKRPGPHRATNMPPASAIRTVTVI